MKNPFHVHHLPIGSDRPLEGVPVASGAGSEAGPASEVGEQTEMMTRLRRRNRTSQPAGTSVPPPVPAGQKTSAITWR